MAELKKQPRPSLAAIIRWLGAATRRRGPQYCSLSVHTTRACTEGDQSPFPASLFEATEYLVSFQVALVYHMRRLGDTYWQLHRAIDHLNETFDNNKLLSWIQEERLPRSVASFNILRRIERRYRLQEGYFKDKLPHQARSLYGHDLGDVSPAERRRVSVHLPDDFNGLPHVLSRARAHVAADGKDHAVVRRHFRSHQSRAI